MPDLTLSERFHCALPREGSKYDSMAAGGRLDSIEIAVPGRQLVLPHPVNASGPGTSGSIIFAGFCLVWHPQAARRVPTGLRRHAWTSILTL
jgi:hypothetical protein